MEHTENAVKSPDVAEMVERLKEENRNMREALDEIIRREDKAWKPFQVFRSDHEVELDEARHDAWMEAAKIARSALPHPDTKGT